MWSHGSDAEGDDAHSNAIVILGLIHMAIGWTTIVQAVVLHEGSTLLIVGNSFDTPDTRFADCRSVCDDRFVQAIRHRLA